MHHILLEDGLLVERVSLIDFPKKLIGGSIGSISSRIVENRMVQLQIYLDELVKIDGIDGNSAFILFCDFKHKGLSGIQAQIGKEKVLKETFAYTKIVSKGINLIWKTVFISLLKSGSILAFESKYDQLHQSLCNISLLNDDIKIIPNCASEVFELVIIAQRTQVRLHIRFDCQVEAALWTKTVSSYSTGEPPFLSESESVRRSFSTAKRLAEENENSEECDDLNVFRAKSRNYSSTADGVTPELFGF